MKIFKFSIFYNLNPWARFRNLHLDERHVHANCIAVDWDKRILKANALVIIYM